MSTLKRNSHVVVEAEEVEQEEEDGEEERKAADADAKHALREHAAIAIQRLYRFHRMQLHFSTILTQVNKSQELLGAGDRAAGGGHQRT